MSASFLSVIALEQEAVMFKKIVASVLVLGALAMGGVVMGDCANAGIMLGDNASHVTGIMLGD